MAAALCLWMGMGSSARCEPATVATPAAAPASPTPTPANPSVPLTDIAEKSQAALDTLNGIEAEGLPDLEVAEIREGLPEMIERSSQLQAEIGSAGGAKSSLDNLRSLQTGWRKLEDAVNQRSATLALRAKSFESESAEVAGIEKLWQETAKTATQVSAPKETLALVQTVLSAVKEAQKRLKRHQTELLGLQTQVSSQAARVRAAEATVQAALSNAMKTLLVRDSVPLWQPEAQLSESRVVKQRDSFQTRVDEAISYASREWQSFAIQGAIAAVLLAGLFWLRRGLRKWTQEEPQLQRAAPVLEVPIATAIALSFLVKGPLYADAPALLSAVLQALALIPLIVILRRLLDRHLYPILYSLVVFYVLDQLRVAAADFPILGRWILFIELVLAVAVFIGLIFAQRAAVRTGAPAMPVWVTLTVRGAIVLLGGALAASVLGYVQLATLVGTGVLRSGYIALALFGLVKVLQGLMLIALRLRPLTSSHIARLHREEVQRQGGLYLGRLALLGWVLFTLDLFQLREPLVEQTKKILDRSFSTGTVDLSLGRVLCFVGAIWLSVIVSRLLRFFLNEEVYERVSLSPGLPYAISTMSNYLVLLVGFLIALGLLGVDLTKITIVASAFSVGLGFGLQNIINNFVSGIILLFERPVKVGDVIQIGDSIGEVRRIGIRASIIRTREGSDIILPNGNLISNQVTNWTYTDRQRAVEIPFTIVSGPDPKHVMDLLKSTVAAQPSSKGGPAPQAYVTAVTASSMSVVVRAWTSRYEDWIEARSDLSLVLLDALSRENIKLAT